MDEMSVDKMTVDETSRRHFSGQLFCQKIVEKVETLTATFVGMTDS
jgi:hypothetical protein